MGPCARDLCEERGAGLGVAVGLRELHHRPVRFARHEERFHPLRIGPVDVHRVKSGLAHPLEHRAEIGDLEREVVRTGAVPGDESREEVVLIHRPRLEQLDRHAVAVVGSHPDLHGPEADRLAAEDDRPAERAGEESQRVGRVDGAERNMVEVVIGSHGGGRLGGRVAHVLTRGSLPARRVPFLACCSA